jgi:phage-related protein
LYRIDFFKHADGSTPFQEYVDSLKEKMRAKTLRSLQLLREFGPELREPNTKPLGDGIFELRTILGSDTGRSLFFFFDGQSIIVTHGFIKKTQKTPKREIERAKKYRNEYLCAKERAPRE